MSKEIKSELWTVKVCRVDSETPVVYENVKHSWWEDNGQRLIVSQYVDYPNSTQHQYWLWPVDRISHVQIARAN